MATTQTDRIRALNDDLRQHLIGGGAVITPGIAALGQEKLERIIQTIAVFDDLLPSQRAIGRTRLRSVRRRWNHHLF